jgi:sterol desaturase/sphingolipid hydroxylase (fatty acid hydroxylase superfamily)
MDITLICIVSFALFFTMLERIIPFRKGLPLFRKGYWVDLIWYTLIQSALLTIYFFDWIFKWLEQTLQVPKEGYLSHWPVWALWLLFFITHDFYIYWFHRAQHHVKWLWRTHEAHHSVQEVDWLAGSRSHIAEILINQTIEFAPIWILLDPETALVVSKLKAVTDAGWGMFIHANIKLNLGKLGYIINGPSMHQWHHAEHQDVYYANYGTKLAIWDHLFGTAYVTQKIPTIWGLPYDYPKDYFAQHLFAFWRFDVEKLENSKWYNQYTNLRQHLYNAISKKPIEMGYIRKPLEHGDDVSKAES